MKLIFQEIFKFSIFIKTNHNQNQSQKNENSQIKMEINNNQFLFLFFFAGQNLKKMTKKKKVVYGWFNFPLLFWILISQQFSNGEYHFLVVEFGTC